MYITAHLALDFQLLKCKIAVILKCEYSNFNTRLVEVQRQTGNADCDLYVHTHCCCLDPPNIQFMRALLCVDK